MDEVRRSIPQQVAGRGLQHLKRTPIRQEVGRDVFSSYVKFAIVRDPYTRMVSQFRFMRSRPDLRDYIGMERDDSLLVYLEKIGRRSHVQWEPQVSFLFDYDGILLVDSLVRFEAIRALPGVLRGRGKLPPYDVVPHVNASPDQGAAGVRLCDQSREMIADRFLEDFRAFGYAF